MAAHPLDPLSPTEYQKTAAVLRRDQDVSNAWRFASINQDNPLGLAMSTQNTIIESESRVGPRLQVGEPANLESDQPRRGTATAAKPRTSWCQGSDPLTDGPVVTDLSARARD
jgi:hypothetical protein